MQNVTPMMDRFLRSNLSYFENDSNVFCPDTLLSKMNIKQFIPLDFSSELKKDGEIVINITKEIPSDDGLSDEYKLMSFKSHTFVHDFTFHSMTPDTDKSLSMIKVLHKNDHYTPDDIIVCPGENIVIEYTTRRVDLDRDSLRRVFEEKRNQYYDELVKRSTQKKTYFFVVIVTPTSVTTNASLLDQEVVDELILRFRQALIMVPKLEDDHGVSIFASTEREGYISEVSNFFSSFPLMVDTEYFDQEFMENVLTKPSEKEVKSHVSMAWGRAMASLRRDNNHNAGKSKARTQSRVSETNKMWSDFKTSQGDFTRDNLKAVVQLPYVGFKDVGGGSSIIEDDHPLVLGPNHDHHIYRLFREAFYQASADPEKFKSDDSEEIMRGLHPELYEEDEKVLKSKRSSYHRVQIKLNKDDEIELGKLGYKGKEMKRKYQEVRDSELQAKRAFSLDTDVSDIDAFIQDRSHFDHVLDSDQDDVCDLIEDAMKRSATTQEDVKMRMNLLNSYRSSRIGNWLKFISDLGTELAISLKQHCNDKWILKRIRNTRCYMLIRPTDSSKHLFYTLLWYNDSANFQHNTVTTKRIHTNGFVSWIDLVSVNMAKLVNIVKAEAQGFCNLSMACEHARMPLIGGVTPFDCPIGPLQELVYRSFLMVTLVNLHDKFSIDDALTHTRFMLMEGFKMAPQIPNPGKRIPNFNSNCKSRFEVWVYNKLHQASLKLLNEPFIATSTKSGETANWTGLFDPFTSCELKEFSQLVNVMYYNYGKNKDEKAEANSAPQMLTKILEFEDKLPSSSKFLGKKDNSSSLYNFHEFSPSLVKEMTDHAGKLLEQKMGKNWKDSLGREIMNDVARLDLESIATLKATSAFTENGVETSRPRVMSSLKKYWEGSNASSVYELATRAASDLFKAGGLFIDLFRKNQHGGLREIYVLSIQSRIVQAVLERISRTICQQFTSEVMTHPGQKFQAPANHSRKVRDHFEKNKNASVTICASDDASKWNQGHFVTKFAIMLCRLTPKPLHNFIHTSLELWTKKQILLPDHVIKMFNSLPIDRIGKAGDQYFERMRKVYKNEANEPWMKMRTAVTDPVFIKTKTGMMQGILHYTSSLFHTICQEYCKSVSEQWLKKVTGSDPIITVMQSSDDSGTLISQSMSSPDEGLGCYMLAVQTMHFKYEIGKMIGIYNSNKSTTGTHGVFEFNSEFFVYGSLIRPTWKWVHACCNIIETDSLFGRQENLYNLSTQVLEGGGSLYLTSLCQVGQALLHYRLLGSSVVAAFKNFRDLLMDYPDPCSGYFWLDNIRYAGLGSMKMGLWHLVKNSEKLSAKMKNVLRTTAERRLISMDKNIPIQDLIDVITSGNLTYGCLVTFGSVDKWNSLMEVLGFPDDWQEQVDERPQILYRRSRTPEEFLLRLAVKAHGPGVAASLGRGNQVSRMIAASVYILTRTVLRVIGGVGDDKGKIINKTTLLSKLTNDSIKNQLVEVLTEDDLHVLFPLHMSYGDLIYIASKVPLTGHLDCVARKRVKCDVISLPAPVGSDYTIERVLSAKWFKTPCPVSSRYLDKLFNRFKEVITWINEDPQITLIQSPFENHRQLQNFLSRSECRDRVVHLTCSPVGGRRGFAVLESVMYQNLWPHWKVTAVINEKSKDRADTLHTLSQTLFMLATSPLNDVSRSSACRKAIVDSPTLIAPPETHKLRTPSVSLYLIQKLAKDLNKRQMSALQREVEEGLSPGSTLTTESSDVFVSDWLKECKQYGVGTFGHYIRTQVYVSGEYRGFARWAGVMDDCLMMVDVDTISGRNQVQKIVVDSIDKFMRCLPHFREWCIESGYHNSESKAVALRGESILATIKDYKIALKRAGGALIVKSENLVLKEMDDRWISNHEIAIESDQNAIRVKAVVRIEESKNKVFEKRLTLLSCPVSELDKRILTLDPDDIKVPNSLWKHYCARRPLSTAVANSILDQLMFEVNNGVIPGFQPIHEVWGFKTSADMKLWLSTMFWDSAKICGYSTDPRVVDVSGLMGEVMTKDEEEYWQEVAMNMDVSKVDLSVPSDVTDRNSWMFDMEDTEFRIGQIIADSETFSVVSSELSTRERSQRIRQPLLTTWLQFYFPTGSIQQMSLRLFLSNKVMIATIDEDLMDKLIYLSNFQDEEMVTEENRCCYEAPNIESYFAPM